MGEPIRCTRCGDAGFLAAGVEYGSPDFGTVRPCPCQSGVVETRRRERVAETGLGSLPRAATDCTFATFQRDLTPESRLAFDAVRFWTEGRIESWVLLAGANGTGKSHLCYAATRRLIDRGESAVYALVPELLDGFRACLGRQQAWERQPDSMKPVTFEEAFADVLTADWLILDDLGAERATDWADERLFLLIDARYRNCQPLLITTNCAADSLPKRIASRLKDTALCRIVDTGDADQRPRNAP